MGGGGYWGGTARSGTNGRKGKGSRWRDACGPDVHLVFVLVAISRGVDILRGVD